MKNPTNKMSRVSVPSADELIGKMFPVLDDGFVYLVDYAGGDSSIVQAARVSYGQGTSTVRKDRALIRYLMRHVHTTPFEMCEIKLHVRVPMDCWRQWIRHRTASVNEYSTRYSIAIDSAQRTEAADWRTQEKNNRQGSGANIDRRIGRLLTDSECRLHDHCRRVYNDRIDRGVAREQARKDLPLSTYTEAYWKIDLHNLFHFLRLRMDRNAQREIRQYANVIANEIVAKWVPLAWEAFCDYRLHGTTLSAMDLAVVRRLVSKHPYNLPQEIANLELDLSDREVKELESKLYPS